MGEFPVLLTNAEAARFLRLDDDHAEVADAIRALHALVRAGRLHPIRNCGRSYKFARAELERFIRDETGRPEDLQTPENPLPLRQNGELNGRCNNGCNHAA